MFGFEVLEDNRLEQLLINFSNEKLHQVYVDGVFKKTQEEYLREAINWIPIDYFNNIAICELLDKPPHGALPLLGVTAADEESIIMSDSADFSFLVTLTQHCHESPYFDAESCQQFLNLVPNVRSHSPHHHHLHPHHNVPGQEASSQSRPLSRSSSSPIPPVINLTGRSRTSPTPVRKLFLRSSQLDLSSLVNSSIDNFRIRHYAGTVSCKCPYDLLFPV